MYDVCATRGIHNLNCPYDGPGIPLRNKEAEDILKNRCPEIFEDGKINVKI